MINVFDYVDYRTFLKDHFSLMKKEKSFYSFRYLSQKTGIDPSFYSKIISSSKHLSQNHVQVLMDFLDLNEEEQKFFETLYQFNRALQTQVRDKLIQELNFMRKSVGIQISNFDYFSEWYVIPIREFLNHFNYKDETEFLAQQFKPQLEVEQVEKALQILLELEMIQRNEFGFLKPVDKVVTTGDGWQSYAVRNFQRKMNELGAEAIERWSKHERDISTLTISTSKECLGKIQERLAITRKEILDLIQHDPKVDAVYQINMQVFPLTKRSRI